MAPSLSRDSLSLHNTATSTTGRHCDCGTSTKNCRIETKRACRNNNGQSGSVERRANGAAPKPGPSGSPSAHGGRMSASCDLATHVRHQRVRQALACRPLGSRPKLVSQKGNATWLSLREVMVAEDVLLQSTFPVLPAGASSGPPPFDWWPTQTSRKGDGDPLGPHVIERGGIQSNSRGRSLADEALHREAVEKHLFESEKTSVRRDQSELNQSITTEMRTPDWVKDLRQ